MIGPSVSIFGLGKMVTIHSRDINNISTSSTWRRVTCHRKYEEEEIKSCCGNPGKHPRGGGNQLSLEDGQSDGKQRLKETKMSTLIKKIERGWNMFWESRE